MKTKTSHNQRIKRLWPIVAGAGLLFAGVAQAATSGPVDLIADGGDSRLVVGDVSWVVNAAGKLDVTYQITEQNWCLTAIHLAVALNEDGIPQTKGGNPIPGKFAKMKPYGVADDPIAYCETTRTVTVDVPESCTDEFVIAAHSVVEIPHVSDVIPFPDDVCTHGSIIPLWPGTTIGYPSYFDIAVGDSDGFNGLHDGWCIDASHGIYPGRSYDCKLYTSEGTLPDGLVPDPDNMDSANWLINQHLVGLPSTACYAEDGVTLEAYTYGDVQKAIWFLVDDDDDETSGLGVWSQCKADELELAALTYGDGFMPGPGDVTGIICDVHEWDEIAQVCVDLDAQTTLFEFPASRDDTAWGEGPTFTDSTWAMYIEASCPAVVPE